MATRVEKQTVSGTSVVVGYGVVNIASYTPPVPPATTGTTTYTTEDAVVDVEIDYTSYYERIATAVETIATQTTTIATKITEIEAHQQKLRELGEGTGIHIISPYEWIGFISLYQLLVDQGSLLDTTKNVNAEKMAEAKAKLATYLDKFKELPTIF